MHKNEKSSLSWPPVSYKEIGPGLPTMVHAKNQECGSKLHFDLLISSVITSTCQPVDLATRRPVHCKSV